MELRLGVSLGGTSTDGLFTLEDTECLALCGNAPCLVVNWRYFGDMTPDRWDSLSADLAAGRLGDEVPPHGTLCRVRRAVGLPAAGTGMGTGTGVSTRNGEGDGAPATKPAPSRRSKRATQANRLSPAPGSGEPAVQLATSRTTAAVSSTLDPGGGPEAMQEGTK